MRRRFRGAPPGASVLLCVYRARNAERVRVLAEEAWRLRMEIGLWALDAPAPHLAGWTLGVGRGLRTELLNRLWQLVGGRDFRHVLVADDDVSFTRGSLARLVAAAKACGFGLAQPAQRWDGDCPHEITRERPLTLARETTFVEIGPLFVVSAPWVSKVLPFPEGFGMGWGLDLVWQDLRREGCRLGVVDAVTVSHAAPAGGREYDASAEAERLRSLLRERGLETPAEAQHTLGRWRVWQARPPWLAADRRRTRSEPVTRRDAGRAAVPKARGAAERSKIPVILAIDVEPDAFQVRRDVREPWLGYEAIHPYLAKLRARFEDATGSPVRYAWFFRMDPQVAGAYGSATWAADRYASLVRESVERGDELASHVHGYRWLEEKGAWLEDFASQTWMDECLGTALDAHRRAFGEPAASVRFGNFWLSSASVNLAEQLGVRFDLTVEPGRPPFRWDPKGEATGALPEVYRVPRRPYEPAREDFRRPAPAGSRELRIVPLTSGWLKLGLRVGARARRLARSGWRHRRQDTPLSMWKDWPAPNTFERMLDRAIAAQERPYLAFAIRSSSGVDETFGPVDRCLRALLAHPQRERFVFGGAAEAVKRLGD